VTSTPTDMLLVRQERPSESATPAGFLLNRYTAAFGGNPAIEQTSSIHHGQDPSETLALPSTTTRVIELSGASSKRL
jgi:hypothetical protein